MDLPMTLRRKNISKGSSTPFAITGSTITGFRSTRTRLTLNIWWLQVSLVVTISHNRSLCFFFASSPPETVVQLPDSLGRREDLCGAQLWNHQTHHCRCCHSFWKCQARCWPGERHNVLTISFLCVFKSLVWQQFKAKVHPTMNDMEKVQSTLKQIVRDWSKDGEEERSACYSPIIEEIETNFPPDSRYF